MFNIFFSILSINDWFFFVYLDDLHETNKGNKDAFNVVRTTVLTLDTEKDRFYVLNLIQEINSKTRHIEELHMMIAN